MGYGAWGMRYGAWGTGHGAWRDPFKPHTPYPIPYLLPSRICFTTASIDRTLLIHRATTTRSFTGST